MLALCAVAAAGCSAADRRGTPGPPDTYTLEFLYLDGAGKALAGDRIVADRSRRFENSGTCGSFYAFSIEKGAKGPDRIGL